MNLEHVVLAGIAALTLIGMTIVLAGRGRVKGKVAGFELQADGTRNDTTSPNGASVSDVRAGGSIVAVADNGPAAVSRATAAKDVVAIAGQGTVDPKA
jgi:hypothetical protein